MLAYFISVVIYLLYLAGLLWGGNRVCAYILKISNVKPCPRKDDGAEMTLAAGRMIGLLERLLIAIGLFTSRWEVLAAVVALKSVARYQELNEQRNAEYFLIGSLTSILWATLLTASILFYDHVCGFGIAASVSGALSAPGE